MTLNRKQSHDDSRLRGLTVFTWNVLADCYCDDSDQGFPFVTQRARDPYERARKQLIVIAAEAADLIGLQEVDRPERFIGFLEQLGYQSTYFKRHGSPLGTLVAIKKTLQFVMWSKIELPENRFLLGVTFQFEGNIIEFYTTHLKAKRDGELARIAQTKSIGESFRNLTTNCIIAGDFNDLPDSECISIMKNAGFTNVADARVRMHERPFTTFKTRRNAEGKPEEQIKTEDYIFFAGPNLSLELFEDSDYIALLQQSRSLEIIRPGLPSEQWPSDHLCLTAVFHVNAEAVVLEKRKRNEEERKVYNEMPPLEPCDDEDHANLLYQGACIVLPSL